MSVSLAISTSSLTQCSLALRSTRGTVTSNVLAYNVHVYTHVHELLINHPSPTELCVHAAVSVPHHHVLFSPIIWNAPAAGGEELGVTVVPS